MLKQGTAGSYIIENATIRYNWGTAGSCTVESVKLKYGCFFFIQNAELRNCWGFENSKNKSRLGIWFI